MSNKKIQIFSPATLGNLGPGFDSIGLALDIWNIFEFEFDTENFNIQIQGEGEKTLPKNNSNLVFKSFALPFDFLNINIPKISLNIKNKINLESGMGSSSSAISAGLVAANYYLSDKFTQTELIRMSRSLESHYDNIAPCILGGIQLCVSNNDDILFSDIEYDQNLKIILTVPDLKTNTEHSRLNLPKNLSVKDFVHNMSRFGLLINSLKSPNIKYTQIAFRDAFHQDIRLNNFPKLKLLLNKINEMGALGSFVCGSGPTIAGITNEDPMSIFYEIADYCDKQAIECSFNITKISKKGTYIKE